MLVSNLSCTWIPNLRFKSCTDSSGEYENMKVFTQNITNTYCDVLKEVQNSNSCSSLTKKQSKVKKDSYVCILVCIKLPEQLVIFVLLVFIAKKVFFLHRESCD